MFVVNYWQFVRCHEPFTIFPIFHSLLNFVYIRLSQLWNHNYHNYFPLNPLYSIFLSSKFILTINYLRSTSTLTYNSYKTSESLSLWQLVWSRSSNSLVWFSVYHVVLSPCRAKMDDPYLDHKTKELMEMRGGTYELPASNHMLSHLTHDKALKDYKVCRCFYTKTYVIQFWLQNCQSQL